MYSIIVAIYNVERFLPQCIESVLAQTYDDFELILVDDGSPDNCPRICDQYAEKDCRIKVIHKENRGIVSARKAGIEISNGNYVCFIDGDDFISCDMLETYDNILRTHNPEIICTGYSIYYDEKNIKAVYPKIKCGNYNKKELCEKIYHKMLSAPPFFSFYIIPTIWSKCFKKSIVENIYEIIPDNISLGEDVAVTYPALLETKSIYVVDYTGYMYRKNLNSITNTYDNNLYEKIKNLIVYLRQIDEEKQWNAKNQINEYILFMLVLAKDNEFKYNRKSNYSIKKCNMLKYLNDPLFKEAIDQVNVKDIKNKVLLNCFRHRFLLPIYVYERIMWKRF